MALLIDHPAPQVRRLTLDRAKRMNALDGPTLQALNDAVRDCAAAGGDVKGDTTTLEDLGVLAKLRADED